MSHINQATFTVQQYSIRQLSEMRTALGAEQYPLKESRVDSIRESFIDGVALLQPLEVTKYEGIDFLTGGRNRLAALLTEYSDDTSKEVTVLYYTVDTAEELILRMTSSNGSRSMSASEKKELNTSAKFGFDAVSVESLVAKSVLPGVAYDVALDHITLALAIQLDDVFDCGKNTGLAVGRSIVTALKKVKMSTTHPAMVDDDGTVLAPATTEKKELIKYQLAQGGERVHELLDSVVNAIDYASCSDNLLPAKVYNDARLSGLEMVEPDSTVCDVNGIAMYTTTVTRPAAWQRNAGKYVKAFMPVLKSYLSEALDINI